MKILALDTSTEYCSIALWIDGELHARETRAGKTHSEIVLQMVDEQLRDRRLRVADLDGIAYGEGPGSFTGLRIACGVVQGLAFGAGLPVVGIGTLLAMAAATSAERVVCALDAHMHEVYHAAFRRVAASVRTGETQGFPRNLLPSAAEWEVVHEPSVVAPGDAPALPGDGWLGCGSGFAAYAQALEARYAGQLLRIDAERYPHAREIARLAIPRFEAGETQIAENAAPVYLRNKVALTTDERASR